MGNIKVLLSFKHYVIIQDLMTKYIWLYSYEKPICYFDGKRLNITEYCTTTTNKKHKSIFEDWCNNNIGVCF